MNLFRLASILTGLILTGLAASAIGATCDKPCKELGTRCARVTVDVSLSVVDNVETWTVLMNPEPLSLYRHDDVKKIIWVLNEGFVFYPYKLGDTDHDGVAFQDSTQANYNEPFAIDDDEKPTTDQSKRFRWCVKNWTRDKEFKYSIAFSEMDGKRRAHNFLCDPTIINSDGKPKQEPLTPIRATKLQCAVSGK